MTKQSDDSFQSINYALRPNKVVARKLIFESLRRLDGALQLRDYAYVGMGSLWFVDFMLAHRNLGIKEMTSIEANDTGYARAVFNAPLKCIKVRHGFTTDVLPTLHLGKRHSIIWLDHDTAVEGPVLGDIGLIIDECKSGSIFLVTVNANVKDLRNALNPGAPDKVTPGTIESFLKEKVGDACPNGLREIDVEEEKYPTLVRRIMLSAVEGLLQQSGRTDEFVKLFDFVYRDGPHMATIGGFIGNADIASTIRGATRSTDWPGFQTKTIHAPPLTLREKMRLDQLLPSARPPSARNVKAVCGFPLSRKQILAYVDHYALYPSFAEFQL